MNMSPDELRSARHQLGLTQAELAAECWLRDPSGNGARQIRHFEAGTRQITGPVARVIELLMEREGITWKAS